MRCARGLGPATGKKWETGKWEGGKWDLFYVGGTGGRPRTERQDGVGFEGVVARGEGRRVGGGGTAAQRGQGAGDGCERGHNVRPEMRRAVDDTSAVG